MKDAQKKWESIAARLNAIPGGSKDWKQWKKTWQDLKTKTKSKQAEKNRHVRGTGGGPPLPDLTPYEEKIINIIDPSVIDGNPFVKESDIEFIFEDDVQIMNTEIYDPVLKENENHAVEGKPSTSRPTLEDAMSLKRQNESNRNDDNPAEKRSKPSKSALVNSAKASNALAETSEERLHIQKEYYKKKLELLERQVKSNEELVETLKDLLELHKSTRYQY